MDLGFTAQDEAFRTEVRAFIDAELPADIHAHMELGRQPSADMLRRWTKILDAKGWSTPGWPKEYGGPGWSAMHRYIFGEELQLAPAPSPLPFGANMVGPVIYTFGTPAQKERFLPGIRTLDTWWCQGFSEPGAGSDLASLSTKAVRDGDHYVVDGQKTWTTYAQHADWIFCLVRTDPEAKKQAGISFLLIDMKTPGITVRPIITIEGGHEVNEVFFDNVRVPVENLVGEENRGWDCAKFLLGHERLSIARVGTSKQRLRRIRTLAATQMSGGRPMLDNPRFAEKLVALEVEVKALELTQLRVISRPGAPPGKPDPATSILKIKGSELQQATTELMMELAGPYALPFRAEDSNEERVGPDWARLAAPVYFNWRKVSIYGGSNEIQKTIIASAILACERRTVMNFELDDDQRLLKDSVDRLLAGRYGFEQRGVYRRDERGYSPAMWSAFAELGLLAMPFAADEGGMGLSPAETMIVMESFGRASVVEPYLASVILAGGALRHGATAAQRAPLVETLASGAATFAVAHAESAARYDLAFVESAARPNGGNYRLNGAKTLVLHGDGADHLIVSARTAGAASDRSGISLFLVDPAHVERRGYATQDGMRAAEIILNDTPATLLGAAGEALPAIERTIDDAIAALCAEAVGAMDVALALTVEYLKTRRQFGAPIGSFQVLRHRAAEMAIALEQARSMALYATMMLSAPDPLERARAIHAAKIQIGRSAKFVGQQAVQLHGGIGMTDEYQVAHLFKRLTMIDLAFGDSDHHLVRLTALGGLSGA